MTLQPAIEAELPGLRAQAEARMTSRCTIKRGGASTVDGAGFEVEGWGAVEADLPCRVAGSRGAIASRVADAGGTEVQVAVPELHVPALTRSLRDGDVAEVTEGECAGAFYRLVEVSPKDGATALRIKVVEAQEPEGWSA